MTPDVAVVIPLNNPLGPADDTVTATLCYAAQAQAQGHCGTAALTPSPSSPNTVLAQNCEARRYGKPCSLAAFPLNHKRMQTVLLAREFSSLMA